MGMRVCGIASDPNLGAGSTGGRLLHVPVKQHADLAAPRFQALVRKSIAAIAKSI